MAVLVLLLSGTPYQVESRLRDMPVQRKERKLQGNGNGGGGNGGNGGGGNGGNAGNAGNGNGGGGNGGNGGGSNGGNGNGNGGGGNGGSGNGGGGNGGCVEVGLTTYKGTATSVDVDGSGPFPPTTGDLSIATDIRPTDKLFTDVNSIKALCTITNGDLSAPFCRFETTLSVDGREGKTLSMGTPPALAMMGGTGDFVGAWGEFSTGGDLSITPVTGGIELEFTGTISFCLPSSPS